MTSSQKAGATARLVDLGDDVHLRFACVPQTPVSPNLLIPRQ